MSCPHSCPVIGSALWSWPVLSASKWPVPEGAICPAQPEGWPTRTALFSGTRLEPCLCGRGGAGDSADGSGGTHRIRCGSRRSQCGCSAAASKSVCFSGRQRPPLPSGDSGEEEAAASVLGRPWPGVQCGGGRSRGRLTILRASHSPPLLLPGAEPVPGSSVRVWGPGTGRVRPGGLSGAARWA